MSRVLGLVMVALAATACGGGGDDPNAAPSSPTASPTPSEPTRSSAPVDASADLSDFLCEPDRSGDWNASGVITNSTGRPADYRVTVVVSEGPGVSLPGKRRTLTDLAPGTPEPFDLEAVPTTGESDPTCQVEVLRLP